jgi:hypothetical protein
MNRIEWVKWRTQWKEGYDGIEWVKWNMMREWNRRYGIEDTVEEKIEDTVEEKRRYRVE